MGTSSQALGLSRGGGVLSALEVVCSSPRCELCLSTLFTPIMSPRQVRNADIPSANGAWWHRPVVPLLWRLREEEDSCGFQTSLSKMPQCFTLWYC